MITLPIVREPTEVYERIEREIARVFRREVYQRILRELGMGKVLNSDSKLLEGLRNGRLTYNRGVFSGRFTAAISRELRELGARWDRSEKCFRISKDALPPTVTAAIDASEFQFKRKIDLIDEKLAKIFPVDLAEQVQTEKMFDIALWETDDALQKTLKARAKLLGVPPQLTKEGRAKIATDWQSNMDIWIQDFAAKEIKRLRADLQKSVFAGNRYEAAVKAIQASYGVTQSKAKFLASQETRLLVCKFKEVRYLEAGVKYYKWKCVSGTKAHPVRPRHRELNDESFVRGKLFRFDEPPITTSPKEATRRNNPGEDYNCRCTAIPVIDFTR